MLIDHVQWTKKFRWNIILLTTGSDRIFWNIVSVEPSSCQQCGKWQRWGLEIKYISREKQVELAKILGDWKFVNKCLFFHFVCSFATAYGFCMIFLMQFFLKIDYSIAKSCKRYPCIFVENLPEIKTISELSVLSCKSLMSCKNTRIFLSWQNILMVGNTHVSL